MFNSVNVFCSAWQGSFTNITAGIETAFDDINVSDDVDDVMLLITDGFHSWNTTTMFQKFEEIKDAGVRIIALGFFGEFAFYSPNLFLMTNEVYHVSSKRNRNNFSIYF